MHAVTSPSAPISASASAVRTAPATVAACIEVDSHRLFNGSQEVRIQHHGQEYRLRQTRNGKLILTK